MRCFYVMNEFIMLGSSDYFQNSLLYILTFLTLKQIGELINYMGEPYSPVGEELNYKAYKMNKFIVFRNLKVLTIFKAVCYIY